MREKRDAQCTVTSGSADADASEAGESNDTATRSAIDSAVVGVMEGLSRGKQPLDIVSQQSRHTTCYPRLLRGKGVNS